VSFVVFFRPEVNPLLLQNIIENSPFAYPNAAFVPISERKLTDTRRLLSKVALPTNVTFYESLV